MQTSNIKFSHSKYKLAALFVVLIISVGVVIHFTLDSAGKVSDKADILIEKLLPELKEITSIQHSLDKSIIDLYLYYATMSKPEALNIENINQSFNRQTQFLENLGYQVQQIKALNSSLSNFTKAVDNFDQEMQSPQRDWDKLREILQEAQNYANEIDIIGQDWEQNIRMRAREGGAMTLEEIKRLNYMQLGFASAV